MAATELLFKITADSSKAQSEIRALQSTVSKEISQIKKTVGEGGGAFESFGSTLKTAGIGIAAVGAAAVAAGSGLFALVKSASDAGSAIYDASQKTNFSAESLSALKNAAELSGGSFETIVGAIGIFEKNMESASQGNKKMSATFKALSIDTRDNEKALRQAFDVLSRMPAGAEQTAAAMQLFGRSGRDVLGVIKETNGDLDKAIAKYREFGTLIDTKAAAAADAFGDQLSLLQQQIAGVAREIGFTLMPVVGDMVKDVSKWLRDNKAEVASWAKSIAEGVKSLASLLVPIAKTVIWTLNQINEAMHLSRTMANQMLPGTIPTPSGLSMSGAGTLLGSAARRGSAMPSMPSFGGGGGGGKGRTARDDEGRPEIQALEESNRAIVEKMRAARQEIKEEYDKGTKDREEYYEEARLTLKAATLQELANIEQQKAIASSRIKDKEKLNNELAKLDNEAKKIQDDANKERRRLNAEEEKDEIDERVSYLKRLDEKTRFYEDLQLKRAEEVAGQSLAQQAAYEKLRYDQQVLQLNRREEILTEELKAFGEYSQQYLEILHRLDMADAEALAAKEAYAKRINEITFQIGQADRDKAASDVFKSVGGEGTGAPPDPFMGLGKPPDFGPHINAIKELKEMGLDAFGSLTQGFASMIETWVQGGDLGPNAFRKMTAAVLAGVAAQAAVKAIFELAEGFAALANPFTAWQAPMHFHAAALFGAVAGVAAIAGRAIAPSAAGGGAVAGTALRSTSSSSATVNPINVGRTGANQTQVLEIHIKSNDSHIISAVRDNFKQKGIVRDLILNGRAI